MDDYSERVSPGPRPAASRRRQYQPETATHPLEPGERQVLPVLETELPRLINRGDLDHYFGGDGGGSNVHYLKQTMVVRLKATS